MQMVKPRIDMDYVLDVMEQLIRIPSPTGFTDRVVMFTCRELEHLGIEHEITRRGAIRANLHGAQKSPDRAIVSHLDTLGAMVKRLKENGRLELVPIGHWSSRFAEGARVTLFADNCTYRGTILPLKASGHVFNEEVDTLPISWETIELRVDAEVYNEDDLRRVGINVGDFVAIDPNFEFDPSGYVNSRHLDNKAGVAVMLGAAKAVLEQELPMPLDCHLLFTISEEVGSGASGVLHGDVAEMLTIDNGTTAPGQNSKETGVTIAMRDMTGPFDYHLTHHMIQLCQAYYVPFQRDAFKYYRSDSASALEAGNDIRTSLVCFGVDASHGYERIHVSALRNLAELTGLYMQSEPVVKRDKKPMGSIEGFPVAQGANDPGPIAADD